MTPFGAAALQPLTLIYVLLGVYSGETAGLIRDKLVDLKRKAQVERIKNGGTFNYTATKLYAFDSFQGLPEHWDMLPKLT